MEPYHGVQELQGAHLLAVICIIMIPCQTGSKRVLFDAVKDGQNVVPKWVPPEEEQESNESRR